MSFSTTESGASQSVTVEEDTADADAGTELSDDAEGDGTFLLTL